MGKTLEFLWWCLIVPLILLIVLDRFVPGSKDLAIAGALWIITQLIEAIFWIIGQLFTTIFGNHFVRRFDLASLIGAGLLIYAGKKFFDQIMKK